MLLQLPDDPNLPPLNCIGNPNNILTSIQVQGERCIYLNSLIFFPNDGVHCVCTVICCRHPRVTNGYASELVAHLKHAFQLDDCISHRMCNTTSCLKR